MLVAGDPAYAGVEARLAEQLPISISAITIDGDADGVNPSTTSCLGKQPHECVR